jgi:spermidine/putrescine transport system substrate-binding protein
MPQARRAEEAELMELEKRLAQSIDRRTVLKAGAVAGAAAFLAACGTSGSSTSPSPSGGADESPSDVLNFANWTYYIDVDEGIDTATAETSESLRRFKAEYGTSVNYQEVLLDNDEFFGTIKAPLEAGQDTGWDIVVPTTWMAKKIVDLGWAEKFNKENMPNFVANLADEFKGRAADPSNDYLAPWQSLMTGLGVNTAKTTRITSVNGLWASGLKGKVVLLTELRDTVGLVMLGNGDDPSSPTRATFDRAIETLQEAITSEQVRKLSGQGYTELLINDAAYAAIAWSGDVGIIQADKPELEFIVPDEGGMYATDNMLIPKGAQHKYTAELWIDFYYRPEIAALIEAYVQYICPVKGAAEEITKIDASLATNPLIFPDAATKSRLKVWGDVSAEDQAYFDERFSAIVEGVGA